jgi:hypothetical protein
VKLLAQGREGMSSVDKALVTQIRNVQERSGMTLEQLFTIARESGLARHGEVRDLMKQQVGMGHGDANLVAHLYLESLQDKAATAGKPGDVLDAIYAGPKARLRPIHDRLMAAIGKFGAFEVAPKKAYVSLRRKKQFAMIGPGTKTRVDVGLNMKGVPATRRLVALPPGGMCQYRVNVTDAKQVDAELLGWIRQAYDTAG